MSDQRRRFDDRRYVHFVTFSVFKRRRLLDLDQPVLFQLESKRQIVVDDALFPNPYANSELVWRSDSRAFTFEYNQRGHQV